MEQQQKITEISIPVPWGVISGKAYGEEMDFPVLCVHGVFDNCDALSHLIPLLPRSFYYVCIDFPGHGRTSPYPPGFVLDLTDYISTLIRVLDHFNWTQLYYLGHSAGSVPGILLASVVPQRVAKLVLIDAYGVMIINTITELMESFRNLLKMESRQKESEQPMYSLEEAVERVINSRGTSISPVNVENFIKRSLVKTECGKYTFTTDQRFKINPYTLSKEQIQAVVQHLRCPVLILQAVETKTKLGDFLSESEFYLNILRDRKNVIVENIEGDHDVHITNPERLVPQITSFLFAQTSHL